MKNTFYKEISDIFRLKIPFEDLYTSVFLIETSSAPILVDSATKKDDVDLYIIPALHQLGYKLSDIGKLVLTHHHSDHEGGLKRISELSPHIKIITDIRPLADGVLTYPLTGHTNDCIGVLDKRTRTLISGDGLQGEGIGGYRCSVENKTAYIKTIKNIKKDKRIENILFSHAYEPWCTDRAIGFFEVFDCLLKCSENI